MTTQSAPQAHSASAPVAGGSALLDWAFLIVPGAIWGASFLFIAEGLEAVGPNGVTFTRIAVGFLTLLCIPASRRSIPSEAWPRIAVLSVVWMAFPLTLFPFAEQRVSSALTGMLNGANPLFVALVASFLSRKAPSRSILIGLGVGLLGAFLVALPSIHEGGSSLVGVLMILTALASYGVAYNLVRPLQLTYGALPVLVRALGIAALLTAPLGVPEVLRGQWTLWPVLSLLALGALGTGVAFVVASIAGGRLGATRGSATTFLIPPVALFLGVLVRHERVDPVSIIGAAVCLSGAMLMRRAQEHATR
jgi:drug/metabolite transporter (DMT)-like permease